MIRVTVWNEYRHERTEQAIACVYPQGIHNAIADFLGQDTDLTVRTATLDEPEHGLSETVLEQTDVLIWWGHIAHEKVRDDIVDKVCNRVLRGMGLIVLHSGHHSKVFRRLMGTTCNLRCRDIGEKERLWAVEAGHPIAHGVGDYIELPQEEMYGERFDVPATEALVFLGWFKGGEVFRSGCCYSRGNGKVFYFQPGHEAYPVYHNKQIQRVLLNAVKWARPANTIPELTCFYPEPLENIEES